MAGYANADLADGEGPQALAARVARPVVRLADLSEELGGRRILNGVSFELASRTVRSVMSWAREQGKAVIFATHILHDAERLCDRVVWSKSDGCDLRVRMDL
jgi:ABC-type multidrug transport system ATPase subunit